MTVGGSRVLLLVTVLHVLGCVPDVYIIEVDFIIVFQATVVISRYMYMYMDVLATFM